MPKKKKDRKGIELPKIVQGVKIPKALRQQGYHLAELARHPLFADLVAAGLVALAAHLRDNSRVKKAAAKVSETADEAVEQVAKAATRAKKVAAKAVEAPTKPAPAKKAAPAAKASAPARKAAPAAKKTAPPPRPRTSRTPASKTTH